MGGGRSPARNLNKCPFWGSLYRPRSETNSVCHAILHDIKFFKILLRIDNELAAQTHAGLCQCGGTLHRANYPRKPRGCPNEVRADHASRFSFCCSDCRKRSTSVSVRFLGRRVYLGLAVVLVSARRTGQTPAATRLSQDTGIPIRTLQRWRQWWRDQFPLTALWQAACARFMPPVGTEQLPAGLLERFPGSDAQALIRLLIFLTPITARRLITLKKGR